MANLKTWMAAALAVATSAGVAEAETLSMTGEFAAPYRDASLLGSLALGRIEGQDGPALANAIERYLSNTHFELMGGRGARRDADGTLSGGITGGSEETPFTRKEKKCTSKDKDGKCIKEEEVEVRCRRRVINLNVSLRIVRGSDGRIVYSEQKPFRHEASWCQGQSAGQTVEEIIGGGIEQIARSVRFDIAPEVRTYSIRVREGTKGMSKEAAKRFKDLIKLTKRDARGACAGWDAMRDAAGHPSLVFNQGLCAEQRGDYARALALYGDASRAGATEGREGMERANRLIAGREDAAVRKRRRN
ncbi:MAG: hypothetical protein EOP62_17520 [Sphingomonadales bacterium]|nr:MAG: hypothetical protein EOP62_17520 [Sphingomonadales bacterium]